MKSRHLSIVDYLDQLQKEFVSAEIRFKVSKTESDKEYFRTIMKHKETKIIDIANRNKIKSIFSDKEIKDTFYNTILDFGLPKYEYRDEYQKQRLINKDRKNYFNQGSDVKINIGETILVGKIKNVDFNNSVALCSFRGEGEDKIVSFENIKRIL